MKEIGEILQKAREEKAISLEQISELTKIRLLYLRALEAGEFEKLPGRVYVKGFLKSYAKTVELDPTKILQIYQTYIDQLPVDEPPKIETRISPIKPRSMGRIILVVLIIFLIGGVGFMAKNILSTIKNETIPQLLKSDAENPLSRQNSELTNNPSEMTTDVETQQQIPEETISETRETDHQPADTKTIDLQTEPEETPAIKANSPLSEKSQSEDDREKSQLVDSAKTEIKSADGSQETKSANQQELAQLEIFAADRAWIRVSIDGEIRFQGIIEKDSTKVFEGKKIIVRSTNAGAIQINFGGVLLGPFGGQDEFFEKVFGE